MFVDNVHCHHLVSAALKWPIKSVTAGVKPVSNVHFNRKFDM